MIRVSTLQGPVTVTLRGAFVGVGVTLRRLTTVEFSRAQTRALAILADKEAFATVLTRNQLCASAAELNRALSDVDFQSGFAAWLGSVECGLAAILGWTGIEAENGPAPLARDPVKVMGRVSPEDPHDLAARLVMETLMLDAGFERQVMAEIDAAARLLVVEGKGSGPSDHGSAAAAPMTTGGLPGAETAARPGSAAP